MIRDRRSSPRLDSCPFIYLSVSPDNGGILQNLSSTGLALQVMSPLSPQQQVVFHFDLAGSDARIISEAEIVWTSSSGQLAGARLLNLPAKSKEQIRSWIASQKAREPIPVLARKGTEEEQDEQNNSIVARQATEGTGAIEKSYESRVIETQDEVGRLRSAVLETKSPLPKAKSKLSSMLALVAKVPARYRAIGAFAIGAVAFAVLFAELIYFLRPQATDDLAIQNDLPKKPISTSDAPQKPGKHSETRSSNRRSKSALQRSADDGKRSWPLPTVKTQIPVTWSSSDVTSSFVVKGNNHIVVIPTPAPITESAWVRGVIPSAEPTVRVFSEFTGRAPKNYKSPSYPELAIETAQEGSVVVQATIDHDGAVREVNVLSGDPLLAAAVTDAIKHWKYEPHPRNGKAERDIRVKVTFAISKN